MKGVKKEKKRVEVSAKKLVFAVFLVWIISLAGTWYGASVFYNNDKNNQFPLLNPRLKYIGLSKNTPEERSTKLFTTLHPLKEEIISFLGEDKNKVAFYVEDLNSGGWIGWQEREPFVAASLLKVPIATCVMKKVDDGTWNLETKFEIKAENKDQDFGELWKVPDGTQLTVRELIEKMLQDSDNTALAVLFENLSEEERNEIFYHIGMRNSEDASKEPNWSSVNKFSAKDLSTMFRALYNATYITRKSSNYILDTLTQTKFNSVVPTGLPNDVKVAHKIGNFFDKENNRLKNYHDCGITYVTGHPYLYCIMTNDLEAAKAEKAISDVNNLIYKYFTTEGTRNE
jgi:beta-lactamase class A